MYKNSLQSLSGLCRLFFYCHKGGRKIFKRKGRRKKVFTKQITKRILKQIGGEYSRLVYRYVT